MKYETGKQNAEKFVRYVTEAARGGRIIVFYADSRSQPWPWMKNPAWQNFVLDRLEESGLVRNAEFHDADNVEGLCFSAISKGGIDHRIERLQLGDTLEGYTPPSGWWDRLKWRLFTEIRGGVQ
jgi:hypothetical protein